MLNQKNDTYLGNVNVKRDGVQHDFTKKEIKEYVKCSKDPILLRNVSKNYFT